MRTSKTSKTSPYGFDKNIPIPPKNGVKMTHDWGKMEVGDSIFRPGEEDNIERNMRASIMSYVKTHQLDWKVTTRKVVEDQVPGYRMWRIK